jgi:hypothetical protein
VVAGLSAFMRYTPHSIFGSGEEALSYDTSITGLNKSEDICQRSLLNPKIWRLRNIWFPFLFFFSYTPMWCRIPNRGKLWAQFGRVDHIHNTLYGSCGFRCGYVHLLHPRSSILGRQCSKE